MKGIGIIKKLSAIILTVTLVFCMFNFTVACGNDDENTPLYTFPEVSDTLIDGAYFITDAGFAEYKKEHNAYDGLKFGLTVAICNNKLSTTLYKYEFTLSFVNGIYRGKAYGLGEGHYLDIALDGDMLYVKRYESDYQHYQYKLDTSYTVDHEYGYVLDPPQDYRIETNVDSKKSYLYFIEDFRNGYVTVGELQSTTEESVTEVHYHSWYLSKSHVYFDHNYLKVGKYTLKIYHKGKPKIDKEKKIVYTTHDSPSLLFEVCVNEDNAVTVTEIQ